MGKLDPLAAGKAKGRVLSRIWSVGTVWEEELLPPGGVTAEGHVVGQHVETAIFGAAELANAALIPWRSWLLAALRTPKERQCHLARFQRRR